jgi:hypothetical protein
MHIIKYLNKQDTLTSLTTNDVGIIEDIVADCIANKSKFVAYDTSSKAVDAIIHQPGFLSLDASLKPKQDKTKDPNLNYFFEYVFSI